MFGVDECDGCAITNDKRYIAEDCIELLDENTELLIYFSPFRSKSNIKILL